jgi:hypothetical protein
VDVLEARGHDVVAISRSGGVDVMTGDGLAEAMSGVQSVIDTATGPSPDQEQATRFFTTAARNLQQAGHRAGARRMVVVSIIGTDRFTAGYGAAKMAHERAHASGPVSSVAARPPAPQPPSATSVTRTVTCGRSSGMRSTSTTASVILATIAGSQNESVHRGHDRLAHPAHPGVQAVQLVDETSCCRTASGPSARPPCRRRRRTRDRAR